MHMRTAGGEIETGVNLSVISKWYTSVLRTQTESTVKKSLCLLGRALLSLGVREALVDEGQDTCGRSEWDK